MTAELQSNKNKQRNAKNETIFEQLGYEVYDKRRNYIRLIVQASNLLIVNKFSFHGNYNENINKIKRII